MSALLQQVADLPPVHWVTHLGLWDHAPFSWVGNLLGAIFTQEALRWTETRFAWIAIMGVVLVAMTLELMWWAWSWLRGRQVKYDSHMATHWTSGPRAGELKKKPINLKKAKARRYAWPYLGLPLYLVAVGMYGWYLMWPGVASRFTLAVMWLIFIPVRRALFIAVARKAYRANYPDDELTTTLWQDVYDYYHTGVGRPAYQRADIEPPFEDTTWYYRFANRVHATFSKHGAFWRLWRFWNVLRFWGLLLHIVFAFFWPIAAVIAPFYYMHGVEDYEKQRRPWWRRYRKNKPTTNVVRGTVITDGTQPA